jgi:hypothetical protein
MLNRSIEVLLGLDFDLLVLLCYSVHKQATPFTRRRL